MAKKSASARSGAQARRNVALVRDGQRSAKSDQPPGTSATAAAGSAAAPTTAPARAPVVKTPSATAAATATKSATSSAPARSATPATTKPAAPKASVPSARPAAAAKTQARGIARAQTVQRNRVAGLISAENYTYVRHDLLLTIGVASAMVVLMVILTFVLPHYIK